MDGRDGCVDSGIIFLDTIGIHAYRCASMRMTGLLREMSVLTIASVEQVSMRKLWHRIFGHPLMSIISQVRTGKTITTVRQCDCGHQDTTYLTYGPVNNTYRWDEQDNG